MKKLFLLFLSILLSLLTAEGFVRLFLPQQLVQVHEGIWRPDPLTGWNHQKKADTFVNTGERRVRFVTDEKGFRVGAPFMAPSQGRDESRPYPDIRRGPKRVIAIGDSFIEGLQVENQETIPGVLEELWNQKNPGPIQVVNDGVSAWSPNNYYFESRRLLADPGFKAGLALIFLFAGNDIVDEAAAELVPDHPHPPRRFSLPRSLRREEWVMAILYPVDHYLQSISHFYVFLKSRSEILRARLGLSRYAFPSIFLTSQSEVAWSGTAKICGSIQKEFQARGIPVFFVLLPAAYQVEQETFQHFLKMFDLPKDSIDLTLPNQKLTEAFRQEGMTLLDTLEPLQKAEAEGKKLFGTRDRHLTTEGNRVVAEFIYPYIEQALRQ